MLVCYQISCLFMPEVNKVSYTIERLRKAATIFLKQIY
jgi:hypothetical protein